MLLGGRSAEEIAFGEVSTGAQNDLQRATDIARSMVTEFGMSEALGAVNYDGHRGNKFLDTPFMNDRGNHSEDTAQKIDAEVKRILTAAHDDARRVLRERRDILDQVVRAAPRQGSHRGRRTARAARSDARPRKPTRFRRRSRTRA